ncbi:unnamed protein product [Sphagnum jensenii]|uniref:Phosphoglycerate mutase-like protein n=1 Tax=Sphagnum jensenii TaxID=128206 RepID=A0ABP1BM88_9BRYO
MKKRSLDSYLDTNEVPHLLLVQNNDTRFRLKSEEIEEEARTTTSSKCIPEDATEEEEEVSAATIAHCATSTTNKKESVTCTGTRVSKVTILEMPVKTEAVAKSKSLFPLFYRPKKTVHLVRHGQTSLWTFPGQNMYTGSGNFDIHLTPVGRQQASNISAKMAALKAELILTSPLRRALQTLQIAFPRAQEGKEPVEVTALHTEHVSGTGDVGRPPKVLAAEFPWLSFESLPEIWWYSPAEFPNDALKEEFHSTEPMEELRKRVGIFRQFLLARAETVIVVIGHSTFFKEFTSSHRRMKNCEIQTMMV